jgi:hypothetical protein
MPPRRAFILDYQGERFRFYFDPEVEDALHIMRRHRKTPADAFRTFFDGATTWNAARARFESVLGDTTLYWTRHAFDGSVLVITCFEEGVDE